MKIENIVKCEISHKSVNMNILSGVQLVRSKRVSDASSPDKDVTLNHGEQSNFCKGIFLVHSLPTSNKNNINTMVKGLVEPPHIYHLTNKAPHFLWASYTLVYVLIRSDHI